MAKLPKLPYQSAIRKSTQIQFGGLRHSRNCGSGELYDMENMSCADYPVMGVRAARGKGNAAPRDDVYVYADNGALISVGRDGWVRYERLPDGERLMLCTVRDAERVCIVRFGDRAIIMPDGILLKIKYPILGELDRAYPEDPHEGDAYVIDTKPELPVPAYNLVVYDGAKWVQMGSVWEPIAQGTTVPRITIKDGEIDGEPAKANTVVVYGVALETAFHAGDAIFLSGAERMPGNNRSAIVREIRGDMLVFSEYAFDMPEDPERPGEVLDHYDEFGEITIERKSPQLDFVFEHQNRLWGASGKTIMCSVLGDPLNWYVLGDGKITDAWQLETQTPGVITGGISYGYPTFFKRGRRMIVYGSNPQNFQTYEMTIPGPPEGAWNSMAAAGGSLIYRGEHSMMRYYSEGYPESLEDVIGEVQDSGAAASDGTHYYIPLQVDGEWGIYHYDGKRGLWTREDDPGIRSMSYMDGSIYALDRLGQLLELNGAKLFEPDADELHSVAAFGDFTMEHANRKSVTKLQLRLELEAYAVVTVWIRYDDGPWISVAQIAEQEGKPKRSVYLPVIPHRCDHYRIKLEGYGRWYLHSLAIEQRYGSPMH